MIGNRLRELRKEKGYTIKELSQIINVSDISISRYENNKRDADIKTLKDLAKLYNVSLDYITCITDNRENIQLEEEEVKLLDNYRELDTKSKTIVQEQINTLKKLL